MKKVILFSVLLFFLGIGSYLYFSQYLSDHVSQGPDVYLTQKARQLKEKSQNDAQKQAFCNNIYFPIVPGASWTYRISYRDRVDNLEIKVPEPVDGHVVLDATLVSDSWTFRHELRCIDGRIQISNLNFLNFFGKLNTITTPESSEGFLLPDNLDDLSSWNLKMISRNEIIDPATPSIIETFQETHEIIFRALGPVVKKTVVGDITTKHISAIGTVMRKKGEDETSKKFIWDFWLADQIGIVQSQYEEEDSSVIMLELQGLQIPAKK